MALPFAITPLEKYLLLTLFEKREILKKGIFRPNKDKIKLD